MPQSGSSSTKRWPQFRRDLAILLWASFLSACVATMIFFAFVDPQLLAGQSIPLRWFDDRMTGYTVGFFFFWSMCTIASFLTAWLIDTPPATDRDAS